MILGPEEVLPGAAFSLAVRNQGNTPMSVSLSVDESVLVLDMPDAKAGRVPLTVPPGAVQSVMVRVKPGVSEADTLVELDNGSEPLQLRVRPPAATGATNPDMPAENHEQNNL